MTEELKLYSITNPEDATRRAFYEPGIDECDALKRFLGQ